MPERGAPGPDREHGQPGSAVPEQEPTQEAQYDIVEFKDGETAFRYNTPGETLRLGSDSGFKYTEDLLHAGSSDAVLVRTESGNTYGVGKGVILNARSLKGRWLPAHIPEITLGRPWAVPGVGTTTPVTEVLARYKTGSEADERIDADSPFEGLLNSLRDVRERLEKGKFKE